MLIKDTTPLLDQLEAGAEEIAQLRETRMVRTYSRIGGKVRINVPPVYKTNKYPFFSLVSNISADMIDPDDKAGMDLLRALKRAHAGKRQP